MAESEVFFPTPKILQLVNDIGNTKRKIPTDSGLRVFFTLYLTSCNINFEGRGPKSFWGHNSVNS